MLFSLRSVAGSPRVCANIQTRKGSLDPKDVRAEEILCNGEACIDMSANTKWQSTVGKKFVMGATGLLLIGFLIVHLAGNLALFVPDGGRSFNLYAHTLHGYRGLLNLARLGLLAFFLSHIVTGVRVYFENARARKNRYATTASKGGPTKLSAASRSMIVTGIVLAIFVPIHISMFSLGTYYDTVIDGQHVRDVYRLVVEKFKNPGIAFGYAGVMFLLGMHLRHGFWSAFQSLGAMSKRWLPVMYSLGFIFALLLAGGFLVLPLYIHFVVPLP